MGKPKHGLSGRGSPNPVGRRVALVPVWGLSLRLGRLPALSPLDVVR
jgi:hypothetical protein